MQLLCMSVLICTLCKGLIGFCSVVVMLEICTTLVVSKLSLAFITCTNKLL